MPPPADAKRSPRTRIRRLRELDRSDPTTIGEILAAGMVAHVAVHDPDVGPLVVPMAYGLTGDAIVLHGSTGSRLMRLLADGCDVCVNVCLLDGLVLARSAFQTSMRYRSVTVFGQAVKVRDAATKRALVHGLLERLVPGHVGGLRPTTAAELRRTVVVTLDLHEASAKVSDAGPDDPPEDAALPIWAGSVMVRTVVDHVEPAGDGAVGVTTPESLTAWLGTHADDVTGVRTPPGRRR